jgi:hypothetical protein
MAIRHHHPHGIYQQEEKECDVIGRQHEAVCFGSLLNVSRAIRLLNKSSLIRQLPSVAGTLLTGRIDAQIANNGRQG